jgi:hypothetical protein
MKNQTFGDNRDLLKFDLVDYIMGTELVERFTYVPMLTPDETGIEEPQFCRHEATGGGQNEELVALLDNSVINEKREIGQLDQFFENRGVKFWIYNRDKFFTHAGRQAYFEGLKGELIESALILIDPDKGLEEGQNGDGNLLFSELKDIYERMGEQSLLMFTQRFPYDLRRDYLDIRVEQIKDMIPGVQPISLDDLDTLIFFLAKNQKVQDELLRLLREYTQRYAQNSM